MSKFEMMRGRNLLLNLNNARIRHNRARQEGATGEARKLAQEVAYLEAMWREHVKRAAVPVATEPEANAMAA